MTAVLLTPIGLVRSTRKEPTDDGWDAELASIALDTSRFGPEALIGLDSFSHVEVIFLFHLVDEATVETGARHPRGNPDWPRVGIFAQRGKDRPNRLGSTVCRVLRVEGTVLHVAGLDAVDGTPVLDLKPWLDGFSPRGMRRQPGWADQIMEGYWS
ncbi:SAM-dependent methyltransferase [Elioraea rosea]|uniref:SAM-dependent methyltransferase n=1 Tax=Elioraea rosea TaxID=2492390 RepID=UPI001184E4AC|nr:SAM-dependent methyltransferase [Elioraea rosea]